MKMAIHTSGNSTTSNMDSVTSKSSDEPASSFQMSYKARYITVVILFVVNLLNYMDRYTIAGVLGDVQTFYGIGDGESGLLQIIFIVGFMVTSPAFGYCGDRYNRKWLMVGGIALWSAVNLACSFVPSNLFWLFVLLRGIVGIGEASYCTIAPTLISDMFVKEKRSTMLMLFYFAIPVGSGLGYIVGAQVASALKSWQWALRVTPALGTICCLLLSIVTKDPPRGMAEETVSSQSSSSIKEDILSLAKNKTFMLSTAGNTCVTFISGALGFFAPKFMTISYKVQENQTDPGIVSLIVGVLTTVSGFAGVALGTEIAKCVKRKHRNGDPLVCAFGLIGGTPFLYTALICSQYNMYVTWATIFTGQVLIFLNWSLVADILMYSVPATRRSTGSAMQIFISHLFGDALSPYLLGAISDTLRGNKTDTFSIFKALQYSLFPCLFVGVLGGGCFLFCSLFIVKDLIKADAENKGIVLEKDKHGDSKPVEASMELK